MTTGPPRVAAVAARIDTVATALDRRTYAGAGLGMFVALGLAASQDGEGVVLCPFRRCTGGYCPGCGLTRAAGALLRGGVATSWRHHPYLLLAIAQAALIAVWSTFDARRAKRSIDRWQTHLLTGNGFLVLAIWAARLLTGAIPAPFG